MPKRQIVLEVDDELADQLEKAGLLDDPEKLAKDFAKFLRLKSPISAMYYGYRDAFVSCIVRMQGYSSVLNREMAGTLNDMQKEFLSRIQKDAIQLISWIDYIELYKTINLEERFFTQTLSLHTLIERAMDRGIDRKDHSLITLDIQPDLPAIIGDEYALCTLIMLLLQDVYFYREDIFKIFFYAHAEEDNIHIKVNLRKTSSFNLDEPPLISKDNLLYKIVKLHHGDLWIEPNQDSLVILHIALPIQ